MEKPEDNDILHDNNIDSPLPFSEGLKDERLINAVTTALQSQTMTPLIKEELRCTILSRRHAEGKGEIQYNSDRKPNPKKVYTQQEQERKLRRQAQNRRAAQRCRQKKKEREINVLQEYHDQKEKYAELAENVKELRKQKAELEKILQSHILECNLRKTGDSAEQSKGNVDIAVNTRPSLSKIRGTSFQSEFENDVTFNTYPEFTQTDQRAERNYSPFRDYGANAPMENFQQGHDFLNETFLDDPQHIYEDTTPLSSASHNEMDNSVVIRRKISESSFSSENDDEFPDHSSVIDSDIFTRPEQDKVGDMNYKHPGIYPAEVDFLKSTYPEQFVQCDQLGTLELDSAGLKIDHSYSHMYDENFEMSSDISPLMQFFMESDMDSRRNGEGRGTSCSSAEDVDIASLLPDHEDFTGALLDEQEPVFL